MTRLHTQRLTLSPCQPQDRGDFIAMERDPEVMRFLTGGRVLDPERVDPDADYLMPRGSEPHVWTARLNADDSFVGWFCLWPDRKARRSSAIACSATPGARGSPRKGRWRWSIGVFRRRAMITASTMAVNHASRRVMEKIGLRYSRREHPHWPYPIAGAEHDEVWYEASRASWRVLQA